MATENSPCNIEINFYAMTLCHQIELQKKKKKRKIMIDSHHGGYIHFDLLLYYNSIGWYCKIFIHYQCIEINSYNIYPQFSYVVPVNMLVLYNVIFYTMIYQTLYSIEILLDLM